MAPADQLLVLDLELRVEEAVEEAAGVDVEGLGEVLQAVAVEAEAVEGGIAGGGVEGEAGLVRVEGVEPAEGRAEVGDRGQPPGGVAPRGGGKP